MASVHDLAEAQWVARDVALSACLPRCSVGDITPVEGVPAHVKHQLEEQAMDSFLNEMLGGNNNRQARERFRALWEVGSAIVYRAMSSSRAETLAGVRSERDPRIKGRQGSGPLRARSPGGRVRAM
jgi:hypothetical protein